MICSTCQTPNDDQFVFCLNCGGRISATESRLNEEPAPPTVRAVPPRVTDHSAQVSEPTVFVPSPFRQTTPAPNVTQATRKSPILKIVTGVFAVLILVGVVGGAGLALWFWQKATSELLPDHLGLFAQSSDRGRLDEIRKVDSPNAIEARDGMLRNDGLPLLDSNPNVILYSDGKDVPIGDLRLIQVDTIKEDGSFRQIDFQASPVDGKPEMKRLRIPDGIANGRYAFALIDGYFNEGKHKFWPFQVKASSRADNGSSLKPVTVSIKPTPTPVPSVKPSPTPAVPPPTGGTVAYSKTSNLILRNGPSQDAYKIRTLRLGEKVYILRYSENAEVFDGIEAKFAYIQTESGQTGWVFSAFLR